MSWITGLLKPILSAALTWAVGFLSDLFSRWSAISELKKRQEERINQANIVDSLRHEILKLRSEGKEVPVELERKLRDEALKLISL